MINRLRCEWQGTGVEGGGLTTFYSTGFAVGALPVAAKAFFDGWKSHIPANTQIRVPDGGDIINEGNGQLVGTWGASTSTQITGGGGSANFAAGVGARVIWETDVIRNGHRVRGATFCVPLTVSAYESNGTLSIVAIQNLEAAATAFLTALGGEGRVWSRPGAKGAGAAVPISRARVVDRVSWLRSRKV